jgi:hypothetical protein
MSEETKEGEFNEELKEAVIMRIDAISSNLKLSIGEGRSMSKEEMIEHVKREDETGKQIVRSHLSFMKSVASGKFTKAISSV